MSPSPIAHSPSHSPRWDVLLPAMSCSKATLGGHKLGGVSQSLMAWQRAPSLLQQAMSLLGLSHVGLQELMLSGEPLEPLFLPTVFPPGPGGITWGWAPGRRRIPRGSSHNRGPGSPGSSWQGVETSGERSNTPDPYEGPGPCSMLCLSFPGHAPSHAEPFPAGSHPGADCGGVMSSPLLPSCVPPPVTPAQPGGVAEPGALTSCSLSAAGNEPRAPWPHRGERPAAAPPTPCPAPAPTAAAHPRCPGHTWGEDRAQSAPSPACRPWSQPQHRLVERGYLTRPRTPFTNP